MKKVLVIIIIVLLSGVFVFSGIKIAEILVNYHNIDVLYDTAANDFVKKVNVSAQGDDTIKVIDTPQKPQGSSDSVSVNPSSGDNRGTETAVEARIPEYAPIEIDFDALKRINKEVIGWIYCEDSRINYPVVQSLKSNLYYTGHAYDRSETSAGAIFVDYRNNPGFADYNIIIYGHHVNNGAMFATLDKWRDQKFFDEHPVMYILTPEIDYKVVLFSTYTIPASSKLYALITEPGEELTEYINTVKGNSVIKADVELDPEAKYVMFSTCSKEYSRARYVMHGMLVPLDSAAGVPLR